MTVFLIATQTPIALLVAWCVYITVLRYPRTCAQEIANLPVEHQFLPLDFEQLHADAARRNPNYVGVAPPITIPWVYVPDYDRWLAERGWHRVGGTVVHAAPKGDR